MIKLAGTQSRITREYILTALMKLTTRFSQVSTQRLKELINTHKTHMDVELQQRACEYSNLFNWGSITQKVLERIPIQMESKEMTTPKLETHQPQTNSQSIIDFEDPIPSNGTTQIKNGKSNNQTKPFDPLALIFGDLPISSSSPSLLTPTPTNLLNQNNQSNPNDLLGLMMYPTPLNPTLNPTLNLNPSPNPTLNPSLNLMGLGLNLPSITTPASRPPLNGTLPQFTGFSKNGLVGLFDVTKQASHPNITAVLVSFVNNTPNTLTNFEFKAAVPKYIKLQVSNPSGNVLESSGKVTQQIKLLNTNYGEKPLLLKIKIDYLLNGQPYSDIADITFPEGV